MAPHLSIQLKLPCWGIPYLQPCYVVPHAANHFELDIPVPRLPETPVISVSCSYSSSRQCFSSAGSMRSIFASRPSQQPSAMTCMIRGMLPLDQVPGPPTRKCSNAMAGFELWQTLNFRRQVSASLVANKACLANSEELTGGSLPGFA